MIKIEYIRKKCNACNYCAEIAPERWKINSNDGKADLFDSCETKNSFYVITTEDEYDKNELIAKKCQGKAIKVFSK
jgi:ferredoxin